MTRRIVIAVTIGALAAPAANAQKIAGPPDAKELYYLRHGTWDCVPPRHLTPRQVARTSGDRGAWRWDDGSRRARGPEQACSEPGYSNGAVTTIR